MTLEIIFASNCKKQANNESICQEHQWIDLTFVFDVSSLPYLRRRKVKSNFLELVTCHRSATLLRCVIATYPVVDIQVVRIIRVD